MGVLLSVATVLSCGGCGQASPNTAAPAAASTTDADRSPAEVHSADGADAVGTITGLRPRRPAYRPPDRRTKYDAEQLSRAGIGTLESRRLRLHTDLDFHEVEHLAALVDQLYDALEEYFGPLPPDRQGREFQMTGYVMRDVERFREQRLVPQGLPAVHHGRHRANEFWVQEQLTADYRRHLVLHEATHCFMTFVEDQSEPAWYLEGMAELFGTHQTDSQGITRFRAMPKSAADIEGFGRVEMLQAAVEADQRLTLDEVSRLAAVAFDSGIGYAWGWAACAFLDGNPRSRDAFRQLVRSTDPSAFSAAFLERFPSSDHELAIEWSLFIEHLEYGYDLDRSAIAFRSGTDLQYGQPARSCELLTDRGWQSSGVRVEALSQYTVTCTGQYTLADHPKPWVCEPQGVSIRYVDGMPLGQVLAAILPDEPHADDRPFQRVLTVGRQKTFTAPLSGTLYLRINDRSSSLHDNRGQVAITIGRDSP
jgi:hypothetical protein